MADQTYINTLPLSIQGQPVNHSSTGDDPRKLKEACSELESMFVFYLLKEMRATVPKSGLFGDGKAEEMYTSMMDIQLARDITEKRGIGISTVLFEKLSKYAEQNGRESKKGIKTE